MRSLSKDPEILNTATYIEQALKQKFSMREKILLNELNSLEKDRALFKTLNKENKNNES